MKYNVQYTMRARYDLRNIYEYIAYNLFMPETAGRQSLRIMEEISSLDELPFRYCLCDNEPWRSQGLRILTVDNYLVFYKPDKSKGIVNIIHIMYKGRDISKQLNGRAD